jgi:hypothetical protein
MRAVGRSAVFAALLMATLMSGAVHAQSDGGRATPTVSGTWLPAGRMIDARHAHAAIVLPDGKVLVAGGFRQKRLASAELFDPATRTWRATRPMNEDRAGALAVALSNGAVAIIGGNAWNDDRSLTTEIYDVSSETWRIRSGPRLLAGYAMAAIASGRVVITGFSEPLTPVTWLFDPATDNWTQMPADPATRYGGQSLVSLLDGRVLVSGGFTDYIDSLSPVSQVFDPATGAWSTTGSQALPREAETRTLLRDGSVLVAGGWVSVPQGGGSVEADTRHAEIYDAAGGAWRNVGALEEARNTHVAARLADGSVLIVGGVAYPAYPRLAERYDPFTGTFTAVANFLTAYNDLSNATATLLRDGSVLVVGYDGPRIFRPSGIATTRVVEYFNAVLDHYFLSATQLEIDALDSGRIPGWVRTGSDMTASMKLDAEPGQAVAPDGVVDVCRIYIPAGSGSHFYSASAEECAAALAQHPEYVLETSSAFLATLPDATTGACPAGTTRVYRLSNTRTDSNHRYTSSADIRQAFIARGYVSEGYGPAGVAFCVGSAAIA